VENCVDHRIRIFSHLPRFQLFSDSAQWVRVPGTNYRKPAHDASEATRKVCCGFCRCRASSGLRTISRFRRPFARAAFAPATSSNVRGLEVELPAPT
jgi:hypothetical protein